MLELQIIPESSIETDHWKIELGMPLFQVIKILEAQFPCIKKVSFNYNGDKPFTDDLVLDLENDGVKLSFKSNSQRLYSIEVYDMDKITLLYHRVRFNLPQVNTAPEKIDEVFGATKQPEIDQDLKMEILSFRGVNFYFSVDKATSISGSDVKKLQKMIVYNGNKIKEKSLPPMPLSCYHSNFFSDSIQVFVDNNSANSLQLNLMIDGKNSEMKLKAEKTNRSLKFGDTVQDVLSEIGSPCKTFFKSEDKMKIHSSHQRKFTSTGYSDYFFNYITLGLDLLFDGVTNDVKKVILHTNHAGHYNFNMYYRCHFNIQLPKSNICITPSTRWIDVEKKLGRMVSPIHLNRLPSLNNTNPFGSTYCFGLYNMIFEVMKNGYIASVTLYKPLF